MPFRVSSGIPNVIIHAKFHVDRLRGFWAAGPPKVPFPILIGTTLTTVLHYSADCDRQQANFGTRYAMAWSYSLEQQNAGRAHAGLAMHLVHFIFGLCHSNWNFRFNLTRMRWCNRVLRTHQYWRGRQTFTGGGTGITNIGVITVLWHSNNFYLPHIAIVQNFKFLRFFKDWYFEFFSSQLHSQPNLYLHFRTDLLFFLLFFFTEQLFTVQLYFSV